ncbi:MAG: DUF1800 domain-containing protein [Pseudomonadota bacterium]
MATSALAQEVANANPVTAPAAVTEVAMQSENLVIPLKVMITTPGTYVIATPASNAVNVTLDGQVVLSSDGSASEDGAPLKVFTTLAAGEHLIEVDGKNLTMDQVAMISLYELGGTPASLANASQVLTTEQAQTLRASVMMLPGATSTATAPAQVAAAAVRQPFLIGGGSARTGSEAVETVASAATAAPSTSGTTTQSAASTMATTEMAAATTTSSGGGGGVFRRSVESGVDIIGGGTGGTGDSAGGGTGGTPVSAPGTPPAGTPVVPPAPVTPVEMPATMARASTLTPPTDIPLTQAVQIIGGASDAGVVSTSGQTLFGDVMDPMTFDIVTGTVAQSGREFTVDVGATTGQFAVRLFPEDIANGAVTVTVAGANSANSEITSVPVMYEFTASPAGDGISQALSRVTYGATPELYARVRTMGFDAYITEQLSPDTINDSAFAAMGFDSMLRRDDTNSNNILDRLFRHDMATSAFTEKQLQDVMGAFWHNHFHATTKDSGVIVQNIEDRAFYRENAFGSFEDLLLYSARSPVMSQFLDNDNSRRGSLNENYAREILELHTVGVDGGYNAEDVIAIARIFTGWDYRQTNEGAEEQANTYEFEFRADRHDTDDKVIPFLGRTIPGLEGAAGVTEGEQLIAILADDPRTHQFVCEKIVQKFVADEPPVTFVNLCRTTWQNTDGDMAEIMRAILTAPEFITTVEFQRNKGKTPYEYAVGVIRALGLTPNADDNNGDFFDRFVDAAIDGGYDPYRFLVPTGMDEVGSAWTSSAGMIGKYRRITDVVERGDNNYNYDMATMVTEAGLETAEEVAAYMLAVATADRYTLEEFEQMVSVLKGEDGIFEPRTQDESDAFNRAAGLLIVLPSFQLQ